MGEDSHTEEDVYSFNPFRLPATREDATSTFAAGILLTICASAVGLVSGAWWNMRLQLSQEEVGINLIGDAVFIAFVVWVGKRASFWPAAFLLVLAVGFAVFQIDYFLAFTLARWEIFILLGPQIATLMAQLLVFRGFRYLIANSGTLTSPRPGGPAPGERQRSEEAPKRERSQTFTARYGPALAILALLIAGLIILMPVSNQAQVRASCPDSEVDLSKRGRVCLTKEQLDDMAKFGTPTTLPQRWNTSETFPAGTTQFPPTVPLSAMVRAADAAPTIGQIICPLVAIGLDLKVSHFPPNMVFQLRRRGKEITIEINQPNNLTPNQRLLREVTKDGLIYEAPAANDFVRQLVELAPSASRGAECASTLSVQERDALNALLNVPKDIQSGIGVRERGSAGGELDTEESSSQLNSLESNSAGFPANENGWGMGDVSGDCQVKYQGAALMEGPCSGVSRSREIVIGRPHDGCTIELTKSATGVTGKLYGYRDVCWIDEGSEISVDTDLDLGPFVYSKGCWVGRAARICIAQSR